MYKRILVPLDRSELAEAPLGYAVWLAQKSGAELVLMHVCGPEDCACEPEKCRVIPEARHYLEEKVATVARQSQHTEGSIERVKPHIVAGDPATQILRYVEEREVGLVIMATHGRSGVRRWLIGSVADKVVRNSNRPVRLMKSFTNTPERNGGQPDQTVLVLLDGSELAETILPYAAYHAGLGNGELILLSVCEPPDIMHPISYHLIPDSYPPSRPIQWYKYAEQETKRQQEQCHLYLNKMADGMKEKGLRVRYESPFGDPANEITNYLGSNRVSLVAMTTRGRSGVSRWALGSVADKVLIASPSPVLIIKPA